MRNKSIRRKTLASGLALVLGVFVAHAQDQEPQQQTPPAQEPTTPQEPEEAAPTPTYFPIEIKLGGANWRVSGNRNRYQRYAIPAKGLVLYDLRFQPTSPDHRYMGIVEGATNQDDYRGLASLYWWYGTTKLTFAREKAEFFDPTPSVVEPSEREITDWSAEHLFTKNSGVSVRYRLDEEEHDFEPAKFDLNQRTRWFDATLEGQVGVGHGALSYTDWRYFDRTEALPDVSSRRVRASYDAYVTPSVDLGAAYARTLINREGSAQNSVSAYSLLGTLHLGPVTDASFAIQRDVLDLPAVQNSVLKARSIGRFNLNHRFGRWNTNLGYRYFETERLRSDRTFIDTPRWDAVDLRISGRLTRDVRLTLRGSNQVLTGLAVPDTLDTRSLDWSENTFGQIKVDGGSMLFNWYGVFTYRRRENDTREVRVTNQDITLGAAYQVLPNVDLYAEYSRQLFGAVANAAEAQDLGAYFPDSRSSVIGANWSIGTNMFLSANYTEFVTQNDNPLLLPDGNVRGRFLTTSLSYQLRPGYEIALTLAPWKYTDRLSAQNGYTATLFSISAAGRF